jgi:UDP-N-acetylglucosamine 2-epimerase (non-hydrolysing)
MEKLLSGYWKKGAIPPLWDGKTGSRIISILENLNQ